MLADEQIDEDLEVLLYAQIYYGKSSETYLTGTPNTEENKDIVDSENIKTYTEFSNISTINKYSGSCLSQEEIQLPNNVLGNKEDNLENAATEYIIDLDTSSIESINNSAEGNQNTVISQNIITSQNNHLLDTIPPVIEIRTPSPNNNQTSRNLSRVITKVQLKESSTNTPSKLSRFLDNIRKNQCIFPPSFVEKVQDFVQNAPWSKKCKRDLQMLQDGRISQNIFLNNLGRRRKAYIQNLKQSKKKTKKSKVICLDSEESDVEVVEVKDNVSSVTNATVTKAIEHSNLTSENKGEEKNDDSDNDIIYVAPPPIPVIDVDESDSEVNVEELSSQKHTEKQDVDDASNDFLVHETQASEKFNFSLHGSEFQNSDFVRPPNPTDVYETESSTSTSDFNRDSTRNFSNTVNTIVFSEVEFPKEDMFTDGNLDGFRELITPKKTRAEIQVLPQNVSISSTTTEDYYKTSNSHQNLPDLSPMIAVDSPPKKKKKNMKKSMETPKKQNDKVVDGDEIISKTTKNKPHQDSTAEHMETLIRKSSKRYSEELAACDSLKKRHKKRKSSSKDAERNDKPEAISSSRSLFEDQQDESSLKVGNLKNSDVAERKIRKKKKPSNDNDLTNEEVEEDVNKGVNKSILTEDVCSEHQKSVAENNNRKARNKNEEAPFESNKTELSTTTGDTEHLHNQEQSQAGSETTDPRENGKNVNEPSKPAEDVSGQNQQEEEYIKTGETTNSLDSTGKEGPKTTSEENSTVLNTATASNSAQLKQQSNISESTTNDIENTSMIAKVIEVKKVEESNQGADQDIIVLDDASNDTNDEILVVDSSDFDDDFRDLGDVGKNLQLANTSSTTKNIRLKYPEFDMDFIYRRMSDDPEDWKIVPADRQNISVRINGPRCNRCRHRGHTSVKCPNKPLLPNCSLCGREGHFEPRCPNAVCLSCGNPGRFSTIFCYKCVNRRRGFCTLCSLYGHDADHCPDLWRRYHLTTEKGPIIVPKQVPALTPRSKRWCSGCAGQGHLEHECDSYIWHREYPTSSSKIFNYTDVYGNKTNVNVKGGPVKKHPKIKAGKTRKKLPETIVRQEKANEKRDLEQNQQTLLPMPEISTKDQCNDQTATTPTQDNKSDDVSHGSPRINPLSIVNPVLTQNVLNPYSLIGSTSVTSHAGLFPTSVSDSSTITNVQNEQLPSSSKPQTAFGAAEPHSSSGTALVPRKVGSNLDFSVFRNFMHCSPEALEVFIKEELGRLDDIGTSPKPYKKKLRVINRLLSNMPKGCKGRANKLKAYFLYRKLNMFLFGVSQVCDGKQHLGFLRKYLYDSKSFWQEHDRESLLEAYSYIFGGEHVDFSYGHYLYFLSVKNR